MGRKRSFSFSGPILPAPEVPLPCEHCHPPKRAKVKSHGLLGYLKIQKDSNTSQQKHDCKHTKSMRTKAGTSTRKKDNELIKTAATESTEVENDTPNSAFESSFRADDRAIPEFVSKNLHAPRAPMTPQRPTIPTILRQSMTPIPIRQSRPPATPTQLKAPATARKAEPLISPRQRTHDVRGSKYEDPIEIEDDPAESDVQKLVSAKVDNEPGSAEKPIFLEDDVEDSSELVLPPMKLLELKTTPPCSNVVQDGVANLVLPAAASDSDVDMGMTEGHQNETADFEVISPETPVQKPTLLSKSLQRNSASPSNTDVATPNEDAEMVIAGSDQNVTASDMSLPGETTHEEPVPPPNPPQLTNIDHGDNGTALSDPNVGKVPTQASQETANDNLPKRMPGVESALPSDVFHGEGMRSGDDTIAISDPKVDEIAGETSQDIAQSTSLHQHMPNSEPVMPVDMSISDIPGQSDNSPATVNKEVDPVAGSAEEVSSEDELAQEFVAKPPAKVKIRAQPLKAAATRKPVLKTAPVQPAVLAKTTTAASQVSKASIAQKLVPKSTAPSYAETRQQRSQKATGPQTHVAARTLRSRWAASPRIVTPAKATAPQAAISTPTSQPRRPSPRVVIPTKPPHAHNAALPQALASQAATPPIPRSTPSQPIAPENQKISPPRSHLFQEMLGVIVSSPTRCAAVFVNDGAKDVDVLDAVNGLLVEKGRPDERFIETEGWQALEQLSEVNVVFYTEGTVWRI